MTVDRIWYILGKKLSGEASEEELLELSRLLQAHPELHYPIQNITDLWKLGKPVNEYEIRQALKIHLMRLGEQDNDLLQSESVNEVYQLSNKGYTRWRWLLSGIAASIIVFVSYLIFSVPAKPSGQLNSQAITSLKKEDFPKRNAVSTKTGSQSKVVLPDGSTVWLNAGSTIIYDKHFDKNIREVSLNGEAYFDVIKDAGRPFIIHTQKINIKVLGTAFNVKSYANDTHSETSLIHGSIEVTMKDRPQEKIIMKPSQKLMIMNNAISLTPAKTEEVGQKSAVVLEKINLIPTDGSIVETSWMDNRFVFRDKTFVDLAHEMERKYSVSFRFENDKEQQLMFSGNFKNETVEQVLQALQLANYFTYSIENNVIVITP